MSETRGEILLYEGKAADALFHQSSDSVTECAENVWGIKVPYLVSVNTPERVETKVFRFTPEEFKTIIEGAVPYTVFSENTENWVEAFEKNKSGRVKYAVLGGKILTGTRVKEIFCLTSACFDLNYENGCFVFAVRGVGNGVGLSCEGADIFAGSGMNYKDILSHYYPGTEMGLYSAEYFFSC